MDPEQRRPVAPPLGAAERERKRPSDETEDMEPPGVASHIRGVHGHDTSCAAAASRELRDEESSGIQPFARSSLLRPLPCSSLSRLRACTRLSHQNVCFCAGQPSAQDAAATHSSSGLR